MRIIGILIMALVGALSSASGVSAQTKRTLVVASYGGSYQDAQRKVFFEPFEQETPARASGGNDLAIRLNHDVVEGVIVARRRDEHAGGAEREAGVSIWSEFLDPRLSRALGGIALISDDDHRSIGFGGLSQRGERHVGGAARAE